MFHSVLVITRVMLVSLSFFSHHLGLGSSCGLALSLHMKTGSSSITIRKKGEKSQSILTIMPWERIPDRRRNTISLSQLVLEYVDYRHRIFCHFGHMLLQLLHCGPSLDLIQYDVNFIVLFLSLFGENNASTISWFLTCPCNKLFIKTRNKGTRSYFLFKKSF